MALIGLSAFAQSAQQVLDRTAKVIGNKSGASANFTISNAKIGSSSGTIAIKGNKFNARTPQAIVWFNGKTQWTYVKQNGEVNISNPTDAELQSINPYNFIYIYRNGYKAELKDAGDVYQVRLTTTDKRKSIQELFVRVDKNTFTPRILSMRQGKRWTTITVSNFKKATLPDKMFTFNSKDYPQAEIIDLR